MKINNLVLTFAMVAVVFAATAQTNPEFARQVGHEGTVLLKNRDNALPLAKGAKVALFGINQIDYIKGGGGSGDVYVAYERNLLYGMQEKEKAGKISLVPELITFYRDAFKQGSRCINEPGISAELMRQARQKANVAIITIGRYSLEGSDLSAGKGDYYLSDSEQKLVEQITAAGFEEVIINLNVGGMVDTQWFKDNSKINTALLSWQGGMEAGNIVADILTGDAYPSGKLSDTFAKSYDDYPASASFKESPYFVNYQEDIYVGYRYFETIPGAAEKVNYEFGFGLSYTDFAISNISAKEANDSIIIQATVKNNGSRKSKEVIQVYFSAPQGKLGKPAKELAAFQKSRELSAGEEQIITMGFPIADMSSYDDFDKIFPASFVLEKGNYKFYVGNSVRNTVKAKFEYKVKTDRSVFQLSHQVTPKDLKKRLLANGSYENVPSIPTAENFELSQAQKAQSDRFLTLKDVYSNRSLMPYFLAQLSDEELFILSRGRANNAYSNTGGMGYLPHRDIPNIITADGPAGLRIGRMNYKGEPIATAFPCGTQQACTWNPALIEEVGKREGEECIAMGVGIWLAPGMNIHRDPLCGRNFEYYSEDPLLTGKTAAALSRGVQSKKVAITLKHFCCNNKEEKRNESDSRVSERAVREIYLRGFEIGVKEGGAWSIMTSYNFLNGIETSENYSLITNILRKEWGFNGAVMTDWNNNSHHAREARAGNDIKMPSSSSKTLKEGLNDGSLTRAELERNVEYLLNMFMKNHLFENTIK